MGKIPAGEFDAERTALELYDNEDFRSPLFKKAYERFLDDDPKDFYAAAMSAAEFILDGFADEYSSRYSEGDWQKISDVLYEHIHAGLT